MVTSVPVMPVAGHGGDVALALQRLHDLELVLGGHAGVHGDLRSRLVERRLVGHRVELIAGEGLAALFDDAQIGSDAGRGERVVAGDHHRADAGAMRFGHGITHFGTRRVDDADHAGPDQVTLDDVALLGDVGHLAGCIGLDAGDIGQGCGAERAVRLTQRAVCLAGQTLDGRENLLAVAFGHRADGVANRDARAVAEQHIGRALCIDAQVAVVAAVLADHGHTLALGRERNLGHTVELAEGAVGLDLAGGDDERHLGRVADDLPLAGIVLTQVTVVGKRSDGDGAQGFGVDRSALLDGVATHAQHLALGLVTGAGELHFTARGDDALDGHLVTRERTGLVGADH